MAITAKQYQQFLVNSPKFYTCDYIAEYLETSGDTVERFLKQKKFKPNLIWQTQKEDVVLSEKGCLITKLPQTPLYFVFKYLTKATFSSKIQFLRKSCRYVFIILTPKSKTDFFEINR